MEKLESKYIVGYLPHELKMIMDTSSWFKPDGDKLVILRGILDNGEYLSFQYDLPGIKSTGNFLTDRFKPILHPLSDLTKEIEVNGEKFVPIERLFGTSFILQGFKHYINVFNGGFEFTITKGNKTVYADLKQYEKLYEWHFDIHGLIKKGLAIDINTLKE